jgi:hypothetical protein
VEVCAVELLMETEVGERLHVVGLAAPEGAVTEQVSATVPENELPGVTVMVAVLPLVAPGFTTMVPLLEREKLVLPLLTGAFQKSPQPAKPATNGAAASNNHARFPIIIAAPLTPYLAARFQVTASPRILSRSRTAGEHTRPIMEVDATRRKFAYREGKAAVRERWLSAAQAASLRPS